MKSININQLQAQISRVMKDVEGGEVYEVMRYSRPVAVIRPKKEERAALGCTDCIKKIEELSRKIEKIKS
ncbi:MAG: hypothetical protein ABH810_04180 [bacterium]